MNIVCLQHIHIAFSLVIYILVYSGLNISISCVQIAVITGCKDTGPQSTGSWSRGKGTGPQSTGSWSRGKDTGPQSTGRGLEEKALDHRERVVV